MKDMLSLAAGMAALAAGLAHADETHFTPGIESVTISHMTPQVQVTVRNIANSPDPAARELRMVSNDPIVNVRGQFFCNSYSHNTPGESRARRAQVLFGLTAPHPNGNGYELIPIGIWGESPAVQYNGARTGENFDIDAVMDLEDSWDSEALVTLFFNPVKTVEDHLADFVSNGAGSAADFLRQDDVFEVEVPVSMTAWCEYGGRWYPGVRQQTVTVSVFYQGDPDITDGTGVVNSVGDVAAPMPNRARTTSSATGSDGGPPARTSPPARAGDNPPRRANPQR
jgi:hypothetical protein